MLGVAALVGWAAAGMLSGGEGEGAGADRSATEQVVEPAAESTDTTVPPAEVPPTGSPAAGDPAADGPAAEDPTGDRGRTDRARRAGGRPAVVTTPLEPRGVVDTPCDLGAVVVEPAVTDTSVAGRPVDLRLTVGTTADAPCRFTLDPGSVLVQVTANDEEAVWDTGQCPRALPTQQVVLRPGWRLAVDVVWSGLRGDRTCSGLTAAPPAGAYTVQAAAVGGEPGSGTFVLSASPATAAPPPGSGDSRDGGQT